MVQRAALAVARASCASGVVGRCGGGGGHVAGNGPFRVRMPRLPVTAAESAYPDLKPQVESFLASTDLSGRPTPPLGLPGLRHPGLSLRVPLCVT